MKPPAFPIGYFFEVEIQQCLDQLLINAALLQAPVRVGKKFAGVFQTNIKTIFRQIGSRAAPVAGQCVTLPK